MVGTTAPSAVVCLALVHVAQAATIDTRSSQIDVAITRGLDSDVDDAQTNDTAGSFNADEFALVQDASSAYIARARQNVALTVDPEGFTFLSDSAVLIEAAAVAPDTMFAGASASSLLLNFTVEPGFVANFTTLGNLELDGNFSSAGTNLARVFLEDDGGDNVFATGVEDFIDDNVADDGITYFSSAGNLEAGSYSVGFELLLDADAVVGTTGRSDARLAFNFTVTSTPIPSPIAVLGGGVLLSVLPLRRRR